MTTSSRRKIAPPDMISIEISVAAVDTSIEDDDEGESPDRLLQRSALSFAVAVRILCLVRHRKRYRSVPR